MTQIALITGATSGFLVTKLLSHDIFDLNL